MQTAAVWFWGANLWVFAQSNVNYSKIFDLDQNHLTHKEIWKVYFYSYCSQNSIIVGIYMPSLPYCWTLEPIVIFTNQGIRLFEISIHINRIRLKQEFGFYLNNNIRVLCFEWHTFTIEFNYVYIHFIMTVNHITSSTVAFNSRFPCWNNGLSSTAVLFGSVYRYISLFLNTDSPF